MKKTLVLMAAAMILVSVQGQANIGGGVRNMGTYACGEESGDLQMKVAFGTRVVPTAAQIVIKGQAIDLDCSSPRNANQDDLELLQNSFKQFSDLCVGDYTKGHIVAAMSNSMGLVQATVLLVKNSEVKADELLNCDPSAAKKESNW